MNSQWINVKATGGGEYGAYLSLPPTGKGPGIVLFQEIFGVNRHIRAVADQYALDGFVVLAPDLFWRQAPRVELDTKARIASARSGSTKGADRDQLAQDILTTVAALRARPEIAGRVGAVGYCMGGRLAYIAAATAGVDAAVCFYGGGIQDQLDRAASIKCPIQFHYGAKDAAIPMEAVEKVKTALAGKKAEFHIYPDANHGFNCWDRASYHAPSAALSHGRTLIFLAQNLY